MCFFFFNATATTEIYTLSLHDALPILAVRHRLEPDRPSRSGGVAAVPGDVEGSAREACGGDRRRRSARRRDRKSTRNSSHSQISYAVFCLKKKKKNKNIIAVYLV